MKQKLAVLYSTEPCLDPRLYFIYKTLTQFDIAILGMADYRFPKNDEFSEKFFQINRLGKTLSKSALINSLHFLCVKKLISIRFLLLACFLSILLFPLLAILYLIKFLTRLDYIIYSKLRNVVCLKKVVLKSRNIQYLLQHSSALWLMIKFYGKNLLNYCQFFFRSRLEPLMSEFSYIQNIFMVTAAQLTALYKKTPKTDMIYCNDLGSLLTGAIYKFNKSCVLIFNMDEFKTEAEETNQRSYVFNILKNIIKISVDIIVVSNPYFVDKMKKEYQASIISSISELNFQE